MGNISHIVAVSSNGVIGNGPNIPWHISEDLKFFKKMTLNKVVIVGRKTYDTIKHLKDRIFIVVTRDVNYKANEGHHVTNNPVDAINLAQCLTSDEVFIAGGGELYKETFQYVDLLYVTRVFDQFEGDAFYNIPKDFELIHTSDIKTENSIRYAYQFYSIEY